MLHTPLYRCDYTIYTFRRLLWFWKGFFSSFTRTDSSQFWLFNAWYPLKGHSCSNEHAALSGHQVLKGQHEIQTNKCPENFGKFKGKIIGGIHVDFMLQTFNWTLNGLHHDRFCQNWPISCRWSFASYPLKYKKNRFLFSWRCRDHWHEMC